MSEQTNPEQSDCVIAAGVQISVLTLETAGLMELHLKQGPLEMAVLLSAGEGIEVGQRLHDAANALEMAGGRRNERRRARG